MPSLALTVTLSKIAACGFLLALAATPLAALDPEDLVRLRNLGPPQFSPDGQRVAFAVSAARIGAATSEFHDEVWIAASDGSGSHQLTRSTGNSFAPQFAPASAGPLLAFLSDRSGDVQIWRIHPDQGEAQQLTQLPGDVGPFQFSPDGQEIAFLYTPPSASRQAQEAAKDDAQVVDTEFRFRHLYRLRLTADGAAASAPQPVTQGEVHIVSYDYSPDGQRFVVTHQPTPRIWEWRNTEISWVSVHGGDLVPLVRHPGADFAATFSPDGRTVAFMSDRGVRTWARDWRLCWVAVAAAGEVSPPAPGEVVVLPRTWDSMPGFVDDAWLRWAADGNGLFYSEYERTSHQLFFAPKDGGAYRRITPTPGFNYGFALSRDGQRVAYIAQDCETPPEVRVRDLITGKERTVSRCHADLPPLPAGRSSEVRWSSFDGTEIEGILHLPPTPAGTRRPLLVHLHGGPTTAFQREYAFEPRWLASHGFAVLQVNPRGSAGYGRDFRLANLRDWGGADVRDVLAGIDHLVQAGSVDPDRLGVYGASYGGFLTGMMIAHSRRFQAAVISAGPTHLASFVGTADLEGFIQSFMESEPWTAAELWRDRSAIYHAPEITTPTLILHGQEDRRVPVSQGQEFYRALRRAGVPTELVLYPRAGHGLQEPKQQIDSLRRHLAWFSRWLLDAAAAGNQATDPADPADTPDTADSKG